MLKKHESLYGPMQTSTVEDYAIHFPGLIYQLWVYEAQTDSLHYFKRFVEGLKPSVRMLVVVQLP
jgi:hypothetical protein